MIFKVSYFFLDVISTGEYGTEQAIKASAKDQKRSACPFTSIALQHQYPVLRLFMVAHWVKNPPAMQETQETQV